MRKYVLAPLTEQDKGLSSLTPEQEKKLVQDVFDRANDIGDQIVKSIGSKHLRANTLNILTSDLITSVVNNSFKDLPSFKGKNDNEKVLAEKFGLVYNVTNGQGCLILKYFKNSYKYKSGQICKVMSQ
jgi:hypothetical protein